MAEVRQHIFGARQSSHSHSPPYRSDCGAHSPTIPSSSKLLPNYFERTCPVILYGALRKGPPFHGSRSSREITIQNASCQMGGREVTR